MSTKTVKRNGGTAPVMFDDFSNLAMNGLTLAAIYGTGH